MSESKSHSCCHDTPKKKPWYRDILLITLVISALLIGLSLVLDTFVPFRETFLYYLRIMLLPVLAGFVLGGMIDYFLPGEYISKHLSRPKKRTIVYAAALGFLMSSCNHGILALSMAIHRKGASGPAVVSFLLASPWANLPVTILLVALFGWKGILIIFLALLIAVMTGYVFLILDRRNMIEKNVHTVEIEEGFSIRKDIARRWKGYRFSPGGVWKDVRGIAFSARELAHMVLGWLVLGVLLASLSSAFVPHSIFERFLGPSITGLLLTLLAAAVIEVCSEGTSPIAFEIFRQTGAFGNAFAFLMGGVVTDYTEIGLIWSNLGKRTALWMVIVTIPQVIVWAVVLNLLIR